MSEHKHAPNKMFPVSEGTTITDCSCGYIIKNTDNTPNYWRGPTKLDQSKMRKVASSILG